MANLAASFNSDEKILDLGMAERGLYCSLLAWTRFNGKDGLIPALVPKMLCALTTDNADRLVEVLIQRKLLVSVDGGGFRFPPKAYAAWSRSAEEVSALRKEAGSAGGKASQEVKREAKRLEEDNTPITITPEVAWTGFQECFKGWPRNGFENEEHAFSSYQKVVRNPEIRDQFRAAVKQYTRETKRWKGEFKEKILKFKNFLDTGKWREYAPSIGQLKELEAQEGVPAIQTAAVEPMEATKFVDDLITTILAQSENSSKGVS